MWPVRSQPACPAQRHVQTVRLAALQPELSDLQHLLFSEQAAAAELPLRAVRQVRNRRERVQAALPEVQVLLHQLPEARLHFRPDLSDLSGSNSGLPRRRRSATVRPLPPQDLQSVALGGAGREVSHLQKVAAEWAAARSVRRRVRAKVPHRDPPACLGGLSGVGELQRVLPPLRHTATFGAM